MSSERGLPPWAWVGCGCVGAIVTLVAIAVGVGFWGVNKARELGDSMKDPQERTRKARDVLGAERLPEGYHAVVAFSIPFVFDFAILSDQPPNEDGQPSDFGDKGLIFFSFPNIGDGDEELYDFFEGRTEDLSALRRENVNLELQERVAIGRIDRGEDALLWVSHRGRVRAEQLDDAHDGLVTLTLFDCGDDRRRMGIWFGPDPDPDAGGTELDLSGSVADPAQIEVFMSPMRPCG